MKKTIWASVLMFVSAALAFTGYLIVLLFVDSFLMSGATGWYVKLYTSFMGINIGIAYGGGLLLIAGGVLLIIRNKFAYHFCTVGTICVSIPFLMMSIFVKLLGNWSSAYTVCMNLCIILSFVLPYIGLFLAPKHKGFMLLYYGMIASSCGTTALTGYALFYSTSGSGIALGFMLLGILAIILPDIAAIRAIRGKKLSFELLILALLFQAAQFLLMCTFSGVEVNAYILLLGIGASIPVTIGGILIHDSIESGFVLVAFGIIFLFAWLIVVWLVLGVAMFIAGLLTIAGVIIFVSEAILMRKNKEIELTKSI